MSGSFTSGSRGSFTAAQAGDAVWQAMEQLRATFDKKVGPRMGRGDVRSALLALLSEGPMHGYQMIREISDRSHGKWKPSAGSVYPTLQLLADEGLVTTEMAQDRKIYSLTDQGQDEAAAAAASAPWVSSEDCETSSVGAVPKAGIELAQALTQVVRMGSTKQHHQAVEVLNDARRRIYSILAQD